MGKIKVNHVIDEELWKTFKKFVFSQSGKIHGSLSEAVSRALAAYMSSGSNSSPAHTCSHISDRKGGKKEKTERIYRELAAHVAPGEIRVRREAIEEAIARVVSNDPRMLRQYLQLLQTLGYIELDGFGVYKLPREIARLEADERLRAIQKAEAADGA